jgi:hypothetical protein
MPTLIDRFGTLVISDRYLDLFQGIRLLKVKAALEKM